MENSFEHKSAIVSSRSEGFGGSDASMFLKVGEKGIDSLSDTDRKRIAVALGQIDYQPVATNKAMEAGNIFEKELWDNLFSLIPSCEYNKRIDANIDTKNFKIFAHPDFCANNDVVEAKCSKFSIEECEITYRAQLQWYFLCGAGAVTLIVGKTPEDGRTMSIASKTIIRDDDTIKNLIRGIELIDQFCDTFVYSEPVTAGMDQLSDAGKKIVEKLSSRLNAIKEMEREVREAKAAILKAMESRDIKKIEGFGIKITVVPETVKSTFDKKAFMKDNPEVDLSKYDRVSKVKSYIKIVTE